ncbi:UDP-4-amino-4,6-dideoxy-N-acetyl-beta-L-altrosamine transaminase [Clostridium bornimense]|uniref:UDP-4-amino-4, 6-dideoxy-N-acetyl-beta-L-altrosamine transaminase n=1 Tax=Clostridium bornimense TaxID=1216932 RepID=UPI001C118F76|nr:UDP-4-amino-4,6-dideoxy-N-acetyl-beta-L-altrosamine transaminase [Clostridium bornimense]MBU5314779.1 UDP-4-amino-4,6-dideoxy-N-acetyl-beta-L-altrosamine transaminase [Clostridium bornimense]
MREKLAINGGTPVRDTFLQYGRQYIDEEDISKVVEVLKGDYLTTGPYVKNFEESLAKKVGAKYAVAVTSGTAALHCAVLAAGISKGDEVLVTPMTFAASANCILYVGATPVFVDIEENTGNIDVSKIEEKITDKTKAIIAVSYRGNPVKIDEIMSVAKKHNLIVVEDAAHAIGAKYKDSYVGNNADMTIFSFHPVKHITTGEGGAITTNNFEFYRKLIEMRSHGITRNIELMENKDDPWYYEQVDLGYNYRMPDINAALGISQMKKLDVFIDKRKELSSLYSEILKDNKYVTLLEDTEGGFNSEHIYVIKLNLERLNCTRREIYSALIKENIGVNVHYIPVYFHPYYRKLGYKRGICPVCEEFYERIITLPLHVSMSKNDVISVIKALDKIFKYYSIEA